MKDIPYADWVASFDAAKRDEFTVENGWVSVAEFAAAKGVSTNHARYILDGAVAAGRLDAATSRRPGKGGKVYPCRVYRGKATNRKAKA